jgi:hypothetical protein
MPKECKYFSYEKSAALELRHAAMSAQIAVFGFEEFAFPYARDA